MDLERLYDTARARFFEQNPRALALIEAVELNEKEAYGMTVEEYREKQRCLAFVKAARSLGLEVEEFVIRLVAESPEQAHGWRLDLHRETADAFGIEWDEYKQLKRIVE